MRAGVPVTGVGAAAGLLVEHLVEMVEGTEQVAPLVEEAGLVVWGGVKAVAAETAAKGDISSGRPRSRRGRCSGWPRKRRP